MGSKAINKSQNCVMEKNYVYYFSGTGNSYYVAKRISEELEAILKPILLLEKNDTLKAETIVFVFPVYDSKPPKKVTEIIENLTNVKAEYVIAIATYGVSLSKALSHFKETLQKKDIILDRAYGVKLPHNAVGSIGFTDLENNKTILDADKKVLSIIENTKTRSVGEIEKSSIFEDIKVFIKLTPYLIRFLAILIIKGPKSLKFTVTDKCIGCNQCVEVCPVGNIKYSDGKVWFEENCLSCFACLQWCPSSAIHIGNYSLEEIYIKKYHHPKVKAEDMILNRYKSRNYIN